MVQSTMLSYLLRPFFKRREKKFRGINYADADDKDQLLALQDSEGHPVFEEVTAQNCPQIHENMVFVAKALDMDPKEVFLCRDFYYCSTGTAHMQKGVIVLNKDLMQKLGDGEQRSLLAHEMQHFRQQPYVGSPVFGVHSLLKGDFFDAVSRSSVYAMDYFFRQFMPVSPVLQQPDFMLTACFSSVVAMIVGDHQGWSKKLASLEDSRAMEYDADRAAVRVAGVEAVLSYARNAQQHVLENLLVDGKVKEWIKESMERGKVPFFYEGLKLLNSHPSPYRRAGSILAEGLAMRGVFPSVYRGEFDMSQLRKEILPILEKIMGEDKAEGLFVNLVRSKHFQKEWGARSAEERSDDAKGFVQKIEQEKSGEQGKTR